MIPNVPVSCIIITYYILIHESLFYAGRKIQKTLVFYMFNCRQFFHRHFKSNSVISILKVATIFCCFLNILNFQSCYFHLYVSLTPS